MTTMKKDGKRQATDSSKPKAKKNRSNDAQSSSSEDDSSPVLVQYIDYKHGDKSIPNIPLNPDLDTLLYPMKGSTFLKQSLRQRAVHITCQNGFDEIHACTRVAEICREMYNLDARSILRETSSDNIFLWLRRRHDDDNASTSNKPKKNDRKVTGSKEDLIQSVEISDVETAIALHKTAGHATYCRAPPKVEQSLVSSLLRATGLGCGQYDPSGESVISLARGEVETFISTPGHITNWHYDFQENFTIQLSGIKRWTIQQGTIRDPIRGCTPHYAAPEAVESQLKAAHLFDRKFRFGHPEAGVNATGKVVSIDVKPGDVFYFPAGMWHKVETIVPGVSINVSLMASNYATVVGQAMQHLLLRFPQWRQPVLHNSATNMVQDLNGLLKELPTFLQQLSNAESIIPPVLQHAPLFRGIHDDNSDDEDTEALDGEGQEREEGGSDDDHEDAEEPTGANEDEEISNEEDEVINPREFAERYSDDWDVGFEEGAEVVFQRNPLAVLHRMDEMTDFYSIGKTGRGSEGSHNVFVLNVNYAGNDMHQSAVRVIFYDSDEQFVNRLYTELEGVSTGEGPTKALPSQEIQLIVSPQDWHVAKFLIYHGYVSGRQT